ncbi:MAG: ABC transporter ATP-binding protein/permease [Oscillospiraceae bacterium]|nr:ABC transporter ATP-binding protein/permease [Oscillospiraceae bacterium]
MNVKILLLGYFRRKWPRYAAGLALVFISTYFNTLIPSYLGRAVDQLRAGDPLSDVRRTALLLAAAGFGAFLLYFIWRYMVLGFMRGAEIHLRRGVFAHLESLTSDFYVRYNTGDIITRSISDVQAIRKMFGGSLVWIANSAVTFALAAMHMVRTSGALMSFIALAPIPALLYFIMKIRKVLRGRQRDIRAATSDMAAKAQENLTGIRIIKAFARENSERDAFAAFSDRKRAAEVRKAKLSAIVGPLIMLVYAGVFTVYILVGSRMLSAGDITIGDFTAFNGYILLMVGPIALLGQAIEDWQSGMASIGRLDEMLNCEPESRDRDGLAEEWLSHENPFEQAQTAADGDWISVRNLTFRYPGTDVNVLKNVGFSVRRNEIVAITGPVGCGKTTLLSLFERLWSAPRGMISFAGYDVNDIPIEVLRSEIGFVPQDSFLFSDSISENIRFFAEHRGDEDVLEAARAVAVHGNVIEFADGYSTIVGERGVTLSGGQMQRVSIARALVLHPKILLLDDCLSAVDAETEREILSGLRAYLDGCTAVIVTHRVAAASLADRIVVLGQGGTVDETGTFDELLAKDGAFAALVRLQNGKEAAE